jgi:alkylation response protein AidB-like acyl-CoA dehydrogenase
MHFAWTEVQESFAAAVGAVLARECPPERLRAVWDAAGTEQTLELPGWAALADQGLLDALAPPEQGGLGLGVVDLVPAAMATGRAALPGPFVEHVFVAGPVLADRGVRASAALGPAPFVAHAAEVDVLVVGAGDRLCLLDRTEAHLEPCRSVDRSRRLARVRWDPGALRPLGGPAELGAAFDRGVLGFAAQLVGLAEAMLERTCAHVRERHQFGVPVGSFQAVKHKLADVRVAIEFAAPLVARAGWALTHDDERAGVWVSMAKAAAADAAELAARHALQCHGAIGYSWEHDLHLWMKRAWALSRAWGDAAWHRERVARVILDGEEGP